MDEFDQLASESALPEDGEAHEDLIQQRINFIRMQLDDTYNIFVNARETLSSISFENLNERLDQQPSGNYSVANSEDILVMDADNRVDVAKSLEKLDNAPKTGCTTDTTLEEIPELGKFFKVMSDLTEGIKKINGHQQSIAELNADINSFVAKTDVSPASLHMQLEQMNMNEQ